jgi:hypothetical protein
MDDKPPALSLAGNGRPTIRHGRPLPPDQAPAKSHANTFWHRMWISSRCWEGGGLGGGSSGGGGATVAAAAAAAAAAGRPSVVINVPLPLDPAPDKSHANT